MKPKTILVLISICLLQGCMSTLIIGTATIAAKTIHDPRTIGTQIDDKILETYISHALSKDLDIKNNTRIINIVYQKKIILIGQSLNNQLIERAMKIAINTQGAKHVYNEVRKCHPISLEQIIKDYLNHIKIRFLLIIKNSINSSSIKIVVENNEVFLLGNVTHTEEQLILKTINYIKSIKHIITAFNYQT